MCLVWWKIFSEKCFPIFPYLVVMKCWENIFHNNSFSSIWGKMTSLMSQRKSFSRNWEMWLMTPPPPLFPTSTTLIFTWLKKFTFLKNLHYSKIFFTVLCFNFSLFEIKNSEARIFSISNVRWMYCYFHMHRGRLTYVTFANCIFHFVIDVTCFTRLNKLVVPLYFYWL